MNNNANGRSGARGERERRQKLTLTAIAVTFTLLLLIFAILLTVNVVLAIRDRASGNHLPDDKDEGQEQEQPDEPEEPTYFTVTLTAADVMRGDLILVNKDHVYTFPTTESHLTNIYHSQLQAKTKDEYFLVARENIMMDLDAYGAMTKMLTAFSEQSGLSTVQIADAYRSRDQQAALGSATKPGYSDHHTGLCMALNVRKGGKTYELSSDETYSWIYNNCYKYGFVVRYPADKVGLTGVEDYTECFRYVGATHAYVMMMSNWCLEEYVASVRAYTQTSPMKVVMDGANYDVFYVAASGTETVISLPEGANYTISGDNVGGFIVTVKYS